MGVLIEGMEMPTVGRILIIFSSGRTLEVSADNTQNIFREAKAVPVPPHGRLIDANALIEKCGEWYTEEGTEVGFIGTIKMLIEAKAPTVIPAEEGE